MIVLLGKSHSYGQRQKVACGTLCDRPVRQTSAANCVRQRLRPSRFVRPYFGGRMKYLAIRNSNPTDYRCTIASRTPSSANASPPMNDRRPLSSLSTILALAAAVLATVASRLAHGMEGAASIAAPAGFEVSQFADDALAHDIFSLTVNAEGEVVVSGPGYVRVLLDPDQDGRADAFRTYADGPATGVRDCTLTARTSSALVTVVYYAIATRIEMGVRTAHRRHCWPSRPAASILHMRLKKARTAGGT